jgi:DNA-binding protein
MAKEIEAVKITLLQIYLIDGRVIALNEEMLKSLNEVIIRQSINQIARSLVRVCETKNKNKFKEIFINHINYQLKNYLLSNYEPQIPGSEWEKVARYSVLLPTQVDGNFMITQTNEKATSNIVKVIISVKSSILEGAVIKDAVIQGRRLKFLYYLGQFISYQYNVEYGDCLAVKDLNNGFDEIEITRFLNEKFRREDIAETVRERFMNEIHKLNVQLFDELGVTVEFHRTCPVSVVEKRKSIKTFEIKDIEK